MKSCLLADLHTLTTRWKIMLSPSSFLPCRPVHGLIFLYKCRAEEEPQGSIVKDSRLEEIFFAKQVGHVATFHSFSTANTSDGQLAGAGKKAIGQMLWGLVVRSTYFFHLGHFR